MTSRLIINSLRKMSTATPSKTLELNIFSDLICPFCYVGYKRIQSAITLAKNEGLPVDFKIKFEPYELDPTLSLEKPISKMERYNEKFGKQNVSRMIANMKATGKEVGIDFDYGGNLRQTTNSHRLLEKAYAVGGQRLQLGLMEKLFKGYFENREDIGDPAFLSSIAVSVGLFANEEDALEFLDTEEYLPEVRESIHKSRVFGIDGVPFTIINHKYAVSGAQSEDTFFKIFKSIAEGKA